MEQSQLLDRTEDHYWSLDSGRGKTVYDLACYMAEHGFRCKWQYLTRARALELYYRAQRGLLSYECLNVKALKALIAQRKLAPLPAQATESALRSQLEQADDVATFDRFGDLPTELQLEILKSHFVGLLERHRLPICKAQRPPITRASRFLRQISLPLLYGSFRFSFAMIPMDRFGSWSLEPAFQEFMKKTTDDHFSRITKLLVYVASSTHYIRSPFLSFELDFTGEGTAVSCVAQRAQCGWHRLVAEGLQAVAETIASRRGSKELHKTDISRIALAIDLAA